MKNSRLVIFLFLGLAALGRADVVEQGPKDAAPSGLLAGLHAQISRLRSVLRT